MLPIISASELLLIKEAAADFRYLLARGYPRRGALALAGNRYQLAHTARQLLHRGVFAPDAAQARRAKLRHLRDLAGQPLGIDGHNVLITLECGLRGLPLVAADDGFIRDVGQVSRAFRASPETEQALMLLANYLREQQAGPVSVFYDAPLSKSGELAQRTRELWTERGLVVTAAAAPVPERELLAFPGPIAGSDTALIDAREVVVDLAGEIIRREGWPVLALGEP
ncbi:MAG: DUF434 domain-containing protein [Syntrophales bacterium]|nr:DUF434 domain-containing protein [Syntrophales bacterium]MDD5640228.1 DUF434 domain-containing protein [Syntrophales bacterium]